MQFDGRVEMEWKKFWVIQSFISAEIFLMPEFSKTGSDLWAMEMFQWEMQSIHGPWLIALDWLHSSKANWHVYSLKVSWNFRKNFWLDCACRCSLYKQIAARTAISILPACVLISTYIDCSTPFITHQNHKTSIALFKSLPPQSPALAGQPPLPCCSREDLSEEKFSNKISFSSKSLLSLAHSLPLCLLIHQTNLFRFSLNHERGQGIFFVLSQEEKPLLMLHRIKMFVGLPGTSLRAQDRAKDEAKSKLN